MAQFSDFPSDDEIFRKTDRQLGIDEAAALQSQMSDVQGDVRQLREDLDRRYSSQERNEARELRIKEAREEKYRQEQIAKLNELHNMLMGLQAQQADIQTFQRETLMPKFEEMAQHLDSSLPVKIIGMFGNMLKYGLMSRALGVAFSGAMGGIKGVFDPTRFKDQSLLSRAGLNVGRLGLFGGRVAARFGQGLLKTYAFAAGKNSLDGGLAGSLSDLLGSGANVMGAAGGRMKDLQKEIKEQRDMAYANHTGNKDGATKRTVKGFWGGIGKDDVLHGGSEMKWLKGLKGITQDFNDWTKAIQDRDDKKADKLKEKLFGGEGFFKNVKNRMFGKKENAEESFFSKMSSKISDFFKNSEGTMNDIKSKAEATFTEIREKAKSTFESETDFTEKAKPKQSHKSAKSTKTVETQAPEEKTTRVREEKMESFKKEREKRAEKRAEDAQNKKEEHRDKETHSTQKKHTGYLKQILKGMGEGKGLFGSIKELLGLYAGQKALGKAGKILSKIPGGARVAGALGLGAAGAAATGAGAATAAGAAATSTLGRFSNLWGKAGGYLGALINGTGGGALGKAGGLAFKLAKVAAPLYAGYQVLTKAGSGISDPSQWGYEGKGFWDKAKAGALGAGHGLAKTVDWLTFGATNFSGKIDEAKAREQSILAEKKKTKIQYQVQDITKQIMELQENPKYAEAFKHPDIARRFSGFFRTGNAGTQEALQKAKEALALANKIKSSVDTGKDPSKDGTLIQDLIESEFGSPNKSAAIRSKSEAQAITLASQGLTKAQAPELMSALKTAKTPEQQASIMQEWNADKSAFKSKYGGLSTSDPLTMAEEQLRQNPQPQVKERVISTSDMKPGDVSYAERAADYARKAAGSYGSSTCAKAVRIALGIPAGAKDKQGSAYMYATNGLLEQKGYTKVQLGNDWMTRKYKKGDILVYPQWYHKKAKDGGAHGHIQIFDGANWISNFKQSTIKPNSKWEGIKGNPILFTMGEPKEGENTSLASSSPVGGTIQSIVRQTQAENRTSEAKYDKTAILASANSATQADRSLSQIQQPKLANSNKSLVNNEGSFRGLSTGAVDKVLEGEGYTENVALSLFSTGVFIG